MTYANELAANWRDEIDQMKAALPQWENGEFRFMQSGVDRSDQHIANLKRMIANLEEALPILEGRADQSQ